MSTTHDGLKSELQSLHAEALDLASRIASLYDRVTAIPEPCRLDHLVPGNAFAVTPNWAKSLKVGDIAPSDRSTWKGLKIKTVKFPKIRHAEFRVNREGTEGTWSNGEDEGLTVDLRTAGPLMDDYVIAEMWLSEGDLLPRQTDDWPSYVLVAKVPGVSTYCTFLRLDGKGYWQSRNGDMQPVSKGHRVFGDFKVIKVSE